MLPKIVEHDLCFIDIASFMDDSAALGLDRDRRLQTRMGGALFLRFKPHKRA
jgi:hypothetical protein